MTKKQLDDPNNLFSYLMVTHAPLIHKSIKSLRKSNKLPPEDNMEDEEFHFPGMVGLMEAVRKYKPDLGEFAQYAESMIRGQIQAHASAAHDVPKHIRMKAKRFAKLYGETPQEGAAATPVKTEDAPKIPKPEPAAQAKTPTTSGVKPVDKSMIPPHLHDIYDQVFKKT